MGSILLCQPIFQKSLKLATNNNHTVFIVGYFIFTQDPIEAVDEVTMAT